MKVRNRKVREMSYEAGECVVFGLHGVCRVMGTETDERDGSENYVLSPVNDPRSRLFVPLTGGVAEQKLKGVLSVLEVQELIQWFAEVEEAWIMNENTRKEEYHGIIKSGDRKELLQMIKTLGIQQSRLRKTGKRLHRIDEKCMKDAKKILYGEFAHVLEQTFADIEVMMDRKMTEME